MVGTLQLSLSGRTVFALCTTSDVINLSTQCRVISGYRSHHSGYRS